MAEEEPPDSLTRCLVQTGWRKLLACDEEVNAPLRLGLRELTTIARWVCLRSVQETCSGMWNIASGSDPVATSPQ